MFFPTVSTRYHCKSAASVCGRSRAMEKRPPWGITNSRKLAHVGINEQRQPVLFLQEKGRKKVELELVAPLETTAALQSLKIQFPTVSSARIQLSVPGNVDVKSGASVLKREVNATANV